jgi:ABC-type multidrug transport system ATPase subunit
VSRTNAVIRLIDGAAIIEDRGSATALRLNGKAVKRAELSVGDQIAIGPFRVVFDGEELVERAPSTGLPVIAEAIQVDVDAGTILQPLNLQLRPGELVAVIGESGAGKTTLLRTLAGVSPPTRGRVLAGGEDVSERAGEIGYVPQFDIVHGQLTVREALEYAARLRLPADTSDQERDARVKDIIAVLGVDARADVRVDRLSGGQRKRVAVGVELLHRPGVIFLDEPTTGLDPGLERRMMELFRSLSEAGQTVVLTTHATGSLSLCQRVILMSSGGWLLFDGTPGALLETFGARSFDDVYARLELVGDRLLKARAPVVPGPLAPSSPRRRWRPPRAIEHDIAYQTRILASRYATLFFRDRRHLKSAFIQIPILAVLTALLFNSEVFGRFDPADPSQPLFTSQGAQVIFFMVTISVWLGSINAAREIVKERSVLARELAVGVQLPAYIASKLVVLLVLSGLQTSMFAIIVLALRPLHESGRIVVSLIAVLVIAGWVAVLLGLVVSAMARSEDQATGVIPILLVPELLFGGAIVPIAQMSGLMQVVAAFVPARWSFAAAGNAIHLQQRIDEDPAFSQISRFGHHFFSVPLPAYVLISMLFAAALCAALGALLQKPYVP